MTEERMTPALEACPKGHTPRWHISEHPTIGPEYGLACDCDKTVGLYPTEAEAIAAWNTRASPAPEPVAAMEPVAWRPIETAPFDEMVLLYCPNTSPTVSAGVCAEDCGWLIVEYDLMGSNCIPTHWMPLPPPPGSEPPATDPLMDEVREALAIAAYELEASAPSFGLSAKSDMLRAVAHCRAILAKLPRVDDRETTTKPVVDPLVEAIREADRPFADADGYVEMADRLRQALSARGGRVVFGEK